MLPLRPPRGSEAFQGCTSNGKRGWNGQPNPGHAPPPFIKEFPLHLTSQLCSLVSLCGPCTHRSPQMEMKPVFAWWVSLVSLLQALFPDQVGLLQVQSCRSTRACLFSRWGPREAYSQAGHLRCAASIPSRRQCLAGWWSAVVLLFITSCRTATSPSSITLSKGAGEEGVGHEYWIREK